MVKLSEQEPKFKNKTMFILKFTKKEYAESLQNGDLYMNNFKWFIEQEKNTGERGQGDVLESSLNINKIEYTLLHQETNEIIYEGTAENLNMTFDDLIYQPVFSATSLDGELLEIEKEDEESYYTKLVFTEEQKTAFTEIFKADHVLVVPFDVFSAKITNYAEENKIALIGKKVIYDDYSINNSARMKSFEKLDKDVFFWKDNALSYQNEYRVVVLNDVETPFVPNIGDLSANSKIYTTDEIFSGEFRLIIRKNAII
ncbi:hypothetical protein [Paenibacillus sp. FSL R7-0026]|uniref:hypothetical protein n=1 Tax=Paenibacillus sp. FSL R7-0026 TaxID=2921668 RepID=UPI0030FA8881